MTNKSHKRKFLEDAVVVLVTIFGSIVFAKSGLFDIFVSFTGDWYIVDAFIAGLFFTSIFTTAPAIVLLGGLSLGHDPIVVALVGGLGAVIGDLVILRFLKKHVTNNITDIMIHSKSGKVRHIMKYKFARWSLVLLGALVIASPFPDELGLTLMGVSKISAERFAVISYVFNTLGIIFIGLAAKSIAM